MAWLLPKVNQILHCLSKNLVKGLKMDQKFRTQKILENHNKTAQMENHVESVEEVGGH
jgi:hypothetical protein